MVKRSIREESPALTSKVPNKTLVASRDGCHSCFDLHFSVMRATERFILDRLRSTAPVTKMNLSMGRQQTGRQESLLDTDRVLSGPVQE